MPRPAHARVDSDALRHNLRRVREIAPESRVVAAIKANAYGHGLVRAARALNGADALAVAFLEEALALRKAGITRPLLALQGCRDIDELRAAAAHGIELSIHADYQLSLLASVAAGVQVGVWLKIDTGMHRLGFAPERAGEVHARLGAMPAVRGLPRLMTHLACADEPRNDFTARQIACFDAAVEGLVGEHSIANSAGLVAWPQSRRDWVRPGIMLYGASPLPDTPAEALGLRPAMSLHAPIIAIKSLKRGDTVGYGATWVCPEDMPVACIGIGYGDGYPRHAPSGTPVLIHDRIAPLIGRVSMDLLVIDLRGIEAREGDEVTLWGEGLPVEAIARAAGTLGYELLCAAGGRADIRERPP